MKKRQRNNLERSIKLHEGYREEPYRDHLGYWTVGYGRLIHWEPCMADENLGDVLNEMSSPAQHDKWFLQDLARSVMEAEGFLIDHDTDAWGLLSPVRQNILIEMHYQMGATRMQGFKRFRAALLDRNWQDAAKEMLDSKWAKEDTPTRAKRLAHSMRFDVYPHSSKAKILKGQQDAE